MPPEQGIANSYVVLAIQGSFKFISHDFVNGPMNPIFFNNPLFSIIVGCGVAVALLLMSSRCSDDVQFYQMLNIINLINPRPWIMGIVWYLPLFLYMYDRVGMKGKVLIIAPLFLPPMLSLNGYMAIAISLCLGRGWLALSQPVAE